MAATQTPTPPTMDQAFARVKDLNEQVLEASRKAGHLYVDSLEKAVERAIELEVKVADQTQQEWLKSLIDAQADVAREVTKSYTTTVRSLLK